MLSDGEHLIMAVCKQVISAALHFSIFIEAFLAKMKTGPNKTKGQKNVEFILLVLSGKETQSSVVLFP